ncbi:MAG: nitrogenase component 1 [Atopobiaceae bacterium]|nr:nitrogenase component 1 [Atopobiaceae bacterium]MCH4179903.1 nitrogenase component 1 [Atopobiaceae bacterium]MCH4213654.1 nitrogenase component 1 [Atopobiaceae bacterium]MCH4230523.1 nitrogenase component 1 [Atopobiaceae bacterium]MCH4275989.1 nitrogenase component 1 [Atopobiaceae bacterium]
MRGLRRCLTPFAPDQSGASSVLFDLGGMIVIVDAGGCAGNVCGFDEPRWSTRRSAIFSAGLRDMDAIMGRDDRLVAKLASAADRIEASFVALVGTPVPAVIGTDLAAVATMATHACGLPALAIDTDGMHLYDVGASKAYLALFQAFATERGPVVPGRLGVVGATPLDLSTTHAGRLLRGRLRQEGWDDVVCYGAGASMDDVRAASTCERNLVVAPSGLAGARWLERTYGTPLSVAYPLADDLLAGLQLEGRRVLVCHQQVAADTLRERCEEAGAEVVVASWFMLDDALARPGDVHLDEEDDLSRLVADGGFDVVVADTDMRALAPGFAGTWVDAPHFAVSGRLVP